MNSGIWLEAEKAEKEHPGWAILVCENVGNAASPVGIFGEGEIEPTNWQSATLKESIRWAGLGMLGVVLISSYWDEKSQDYEIVTEEYPLSEEEEEEVQCQCHCGCEEIATDHDDWGTPLCDECAKQMVEYAPGDFWCGQEFDGETCPDCETEIKWGIIMTSSNLGQGAPNTTFGQCKCDGREWCEEDKGGWVISVVDRTDLSGRAE